MWTESEEDYKPVPGDWIVAKLIELETSLREQDRRFRELKPRHFLDPTAFYEAVARGDVDGAVELVAEKYGLDASRVRLDWVSDIGNQRVAAHVRCDPFGPIEVTIRAHYKKYARGFGTVIAHELGHAYLTDMGIENGGAWHAEATTDLVTFVKGLGKLTVNGVDQLDSGQRAGSRCYGYLNREAMVFAYARTALHYGVGRDEARAGLHDAALGYLNVLTDEPGFLERAWNALLRALGRRKKVTDRDLAVDADGNIIDATTGERL
jgi:hypothetical protein